MSVANAVLEEDHSYVCKFREINEKFLSLLPKLEIYIPTVAQLNDPLEGVLTEGYAVSCNPPPVKSDVESYLQTVGVYSVSIHKQKWHGSNFLPMWASYANNHSGVCMVFKRKPLTDERFKWVKVQYVTHPHNHKNEQPQRLMPLTFTQDLFGNAQAKLSEKYDYWRHEHEFRLIAQPGCTGHQAMDQFFDLHALVFGFSAKQDEILNVLNQLPDNTKHKLMSADDVGIFQVVKPNTLFMTQPLDNLRPSLKLA